MIIMIAAAIAAAAPAQPANGPARQHDMAQHQQMQHQQGAQHQQHQGMECCKKCCKDMAEHKGHAPDAKAPGGHHSH